MRLRYHVEQQVNRRSPAGAGIAIPVYFKDTARENNFRITFLEADRPFPVNSATIPVQQSGRGQDESARAERPNFGAMLDNPAKFREQMLILDLVRPDPTAYKQDIQTGGIRAPCPAEC